MASVADLLGRLRRGGNHASATEVDVTAEQLVGVYQEHVPSEANVLVAPYFGQLLRVRGEVRDVVAAGGRTIVRFDRRHDSPRVRVEMLFDEAHGSTAENVRPGAEAVVVGQIVEVNRAQVTLDHCRVAADA